MTFLLIKPVRHGIPAHLSQHLRDHSKHRFVVVIVNRWVYDNLSIYALVGIHANFHVFLCYIHYRFSHTQWLAHGSHTSRNDPAHGGNFFGLKYNSIKKSDL